MSRPTRVLSLYEGFFAGGARVLHTDVVATLNGAQSHTVLSLASEARREGTVQPMADDARYRRLVEAGVPVHTLGMTAAAAPPQRDGFTPSQLAEAASLVNRADVVLSLKEQPVGLLLALADAGLLLPRPVAVCLHRSDPSHSGDALGWLGEAVERGIVTATISCAHTTRDAYLAAGARTGNDLVVTNGIDTARFRPGTTAELEQTRRELDIPAGAPVVLLAARFDAMKNPALFLAAAAEHAQQDPDTHYVVCGAGMSFDNAPFRILAETTPIPEGRLHALGVRNDMPRLYQVADVVALTSAFGEASPLCLLEGAACGATPVTTDTGDAAREVQGIGHVVAPSPRAFARAFTQSIEDREFGRAAALDARPRLDRSRMLRGYREAIEVLRRA